MIGMKKHNDLPEPVTGSHHIAGARGGSLDRLYLVLVEIERRSSLSTCRAWLLKKFRRVGVQ